MTYTAPRNWDQLSPGYSGSFATHMNELEAVVALGASPFADIRNYGTTGTADDSAAITAAHAALPSTGGAIVLPAGVTYAQGLSFTKPVTLMGLGFNTSILRLASGANVDLLTLDAQFCTVRDLSLDGNYPSNLTAGNALVVKQTKCILHNLWVVNARGSGIKVIGTSGAPAHALLASNVYVYGCQDTGTVGSIYLADYSYDSKWTNVWVGGIPAAKGSFGILMNGAGAQPTETNFTNLHVWGKGSDGIKCQADNLRLTAPYIETNNGHGLNLTSCKGALVTGGRIWSNPGSGIYCFNGARHGFANMRIDDNAIDGIRGDGNCADVRVSSCDFNNENSGGQDYPVHTISTCDRWIVTGCVGKAADHAVGTFTLTGASNVTANNIS